MCISYPISHFTKGNVSDYRVNVMPCRHWQIAWLTSKSEKIGWRLRNSFLGTKKISRASHAEKNITPGIV